LKHESFIAGILHARRWIPVSERLPEEGQWVLIQGEWFNDPKKFWSDPGYAQWKNGQFMPDTDQIGGLDYQVEPYSKVTHWMSLPPKPITLPEEIK
jgi:hypothetical protein